MSSAFIPKTCTFVNGLLIVKDINVWIYSTSLVNRARVRISGLKYPTLPKIYKIPFLLLSSSNAVLEHYSVDFPILKPTISTISMVPLANAESQKTMYVLKFITAAFLEDGYTLLQEPNKLSSYIDIEFYMLTSSMDSFLADLGSGLEDRSDYPCDIAGMKASIYAQKPKCVLKKGPATATSDSVVTIRVLDFNPVLKGTEITISIPLVNTERNSFNIKS